MFAATTYQQRRRALGQRLGSGLVLLLGHRDSPMNFRDNAYDFRQDASFSYFCGLDQPDLAEIEIRELLRTEGMEIFRVAGSLTGEPFTAEARRLVVFARKQVG